MSAISLPAKAVFLAWLRSVNGRLQARRVVLGSAPSGSFDASNCRLVFLKADGIGDFVLCTVFFNEIRSYLRNVEVTLLCSNPTAELAQALYPDWKIIPLPMGKKGRIAMWPLRSHLRRSIERVPDSDFLVDLRAIRYCQDSVMASWVPAQRKIALRNQNKWPIFAYPKEEEIYTDLLDVPEESSRDDQCQDILNYRQLSHFFLPKRNSLGGWPYLPDFPEHWERIAAQLPDPAKIIVICPFSSETIKEYPYERLAEAAGRFAQEAGLLPCILGGTDCLERSEAVSRYLAGFGPVENLTGRLSLVEAAALLRRARVVLAVDTGLAHIAIAEGAPTVALLGGGHYRHFAPWGNQQRTIWLTKNLPCFGCNWACIYDVPRCIHEISASQIIFALRKVVERINSVHQ